MRYVFFLMTISLFIMSCGQTDTKQKELELKERELALREKELESKLKDTLTSTSRQIETQVEEKEFTIAEISNESKSIPDFQGSAIYLRFKKDFEGSFLFIGQAGEWGVISINGKVVKLNFVTGSDKAATYANADYQMSYSLDYSKAPKNVESPTAPGSITIKGNGYKTYQNKIWGEWGVN